MKEKQMEWLRRDNGEHNWEDLWEVLRAGLIDDVLSELLLSHSLVDYHRLPAEFNDTLLRLRTAMISRDLETRLPSNSLAPYTIGLHCLQIALETSELLSKAKVDLFVESTGAIVPIPSFDRERVAFTEIAEIPIDPDDHLKPNSLKRIIKISITEDCITDNPLPIERLEREFSRLREAMIKMDPETRCKPLGCSVGGRADLDSNDHLNIHGQKITRWREFNVSCNELSDDEPTQIVLKMEREMESENLCFEGRCSGRHQLIY